MRERERERPGAACIFPAWQGHRSFHWWKGHHERQESLRHLANPLNEQPYKSEGISVENGEDTPSPLRHGEKEESFLCRVTHAGDLFKEKLLEPT